MTNCTLQCIAIEDINPQAPVHFLVIPKKEIRRMMDISDEDEQVGNNNNNNINNNNNNNNNK